MRLEIGQNYGIELMHAEAKSEDFSSDESTFYDHIISFDTSTCARLVNRIADFWLTSCTFRQR